VKERKKLVQHDFFLHLLSLHLNQVGDVKEEREKENAMTSILWKLFFIFFTSGNC
jgi:hypothetical protein